MSELARRLIKENKKTKNTFLDLGRCGMINYLPEELSGCEWLEWLNLGDNYYDSKLNTFVESKNSRESNSFRGNELPVLKNLTQLVSLDLCSTQIQETSFLQNLTHLTSLDLSNNKLRYTAFLYDLIQLQSLKLGSNQIDDISYLEGLTQLRILQLHENKIKDISYLQNLTQLQYLTLNNNIIKGSSFLQNLTQLQTLDLHDNKIKSASFLENLSQLEYLDISNNQIQSISFLQKFPQLETIVLRNNGIQDIHFSQNLHRLESLDLNANKIQDISFLKNLSQLQSLDLSGNQIQDISFLENLNQLQILELSSNQIQDYSFLKKLSQLQSLCLIDNKIKDISFLQSLTLLKGLDLSHNQIQDISFLQNLRELEHLNLSHNQIQDIFFLQDLMKLRYLVLNYNDIQDIEPILPLLKNELELSLSGYPRNGILLSGNTLINPPKEIAEQGREAIIRYFDRIEEQGKDFIYEAKLTLVGDGGAGKTSLQRKILDDNADLPDGKDRTRGIKVYDWQFDDINQITYTTHIWDFGGQDVYYPVHRFFLTENSVYILMASTRYATHNFEYWIPTIYQFGGVSPIILVQTCDHGEQKDWLDIKPFYGVIEYNLKPLYKIDLSSPDNWGLKKLKGFIKHQITELPHIGKAVPKSWVKVREELIEKAKTDDYISFEKFFDLCLDIDKSAFSELIDIEDLARFLHDIGIILWYHNKDLLKNFIIIKPEWAMNAVYKIIDDVAIQRQNGVINQADFKRIWGETSYQTKISELKLMLQVFKIAFPKQHQTQAYLLPARLQPIPDENRWSNYENYLKLEYHFEVMPRGIINQLSAELSNKIVSDETIWSNAVILKQDNSQVQITEEIRKEKILIKAWGNDARGLIMLVMNSISNIVNEYKGVKPLVRVPCSCEICQTHKTPTIFDYEELIELSDKNRQTVTCNKSDTKLSISQLLYSVGLEQKGSPLKTIEEKPLTLAKKVFVTYCWTDKDEKNDMPHQTKVHRLVNALRKRGFDATFDKALNDASTATNFIRMMVDNMYKNDKVIVVLSEGYSIKANDFRGGAGEEYELIINDIKENKNKYILVTFSGRNKEIYPFGLKGRDTIDLSTLDTNEIENLIRKLKGLPSVILEDLGTDTNSYNPTSAPPLF